MSNKSSRFALFGGRRLFIPLAILLALGLAAFDTAPKDQGIGGTGAIFSGEDQGLTGTGYFGTISDFGSIIINGFEIDVSDAIIVKIDGVRAQISDLKIGQVIAARSVVTASHEQIQSVDVLHAVIGPLESIDPVTGLGFVLGQTIDFNSRIDHETISKNEWIAVSGLRAQSGVIVASRIEKMREGHFLVRGDATQIEKAFAALHLNSQPSPAGSSLVLSGSMIAGRPQIQSLRQVPLTAILSNTKTLVVETYLPAMVAGQDRPTLTLFGEKLVLKNNMMAALPSSQTRRVLEGVNHNGQMLVTRIAPAPFDDRRSGASVKQTILENASKKRSGAAQSASPSEPSSATSETDTTESNPSADSQGSEGEAGAAGKSGNGGNKGGGDKGGDKSEKD